LLAVAFAEVLLVVVVRFCIFGDAAAAEVADGGSRANRARDEDGGCIPVIVLELYHTYVAAVLLNCFEF